MIDQVPPTRIDEDAPATTRQERLVSATPEQVFALLADVDDWPRWQPEVSAVSAEQPIALGSTFRWRSGVRITSTVTAFEPGRALAWTGRAIGTRAIHTWTFEAVDGGTRVHTEESMTGWLPRLMPSMVQRTLDKGVTSVLDALEEALR